MENGMQEFIREAKTEEGTVFQWSGYKKQQWK
jgi:hypothetical protein